MIWHVTPNNDLKEHRDDSTCECDPRIKHVNGNTIVIHNSYDGREGVEWANELLNNTTDE